MTQFLFEEIGGGPWEVGFERIAANKLSELVRGVSRRRHLWPHFIKPYVPPPAGYLPGGLAARKPSADYRNFRFHPCILAKRGIEVRFSGFKFQEYLNFQDLPPKLSYHVIFILLGIA